MTSKINAITTGAGGIEVTGDSSGQIEFQADGTTVATLTTSGLDVSSGLTFGSPIDIASGGTGQTTANSAFNALVPSQTGNSGKYLTTDGTDTSWATVVSALSGEIKAIASNLTGAYTIPASGTVDASGFMYCDGSAIPAGKTVSGNVPDLTDGRFLRGSTSAGSTGGAETFTLAETNLPSHTHSFSGSTGSAGGHSHTGGSKRIHDSSDGQYGAISNVGSTSFPLSRFGTANYDLDYTSTVGGHSHTVSGTIGSTGSGTAVSHIPKYVNVQYIIKVD